MAIKSFADVVAEQQSASTGVKTFADFYNEQQALIAPKPVTPTPQDEHWLSRTAGRAGSLAAQETVQLLDAVTFDQIDYLDTASDYWKQKALENEKDTGNIRDAWAAGGGEFGKFIVENLGDSIGTMFPSLTLAIATGGLGGTIGAARASAAVAGTGILPAQAAVWGARAGQRIGAMGGLVAGGAISHGNQTVDMLQEEGLTPTAGNVVPTALAKAGLDAFGLGKIASGLGLGRFFGSHVVEEVQKRGLTGLAKTVAVGTGAEGVTEALQEAIDVGVVAALKNESLWKAYPREMSRIVDAGLTGAALGATVSAAGTVMPQARTPEDKAKEYVELINQRLAKRRQDLKDAEANPPELYKDPGFETMLGAPVPEFGEDVSPAPPRGQEFPAPIPPPAPPPAQPGPAPIGGIAREIVTPFQQEPVEDFEPAVPFADYAPYDYDGGVQKDTLRREAIIAGLDNVATEANGLAFISRKTGEDTVAIMVTGKGGKSRKLFDAKINVTGEVATVTVPKMVGVQSNAVTHFVDSIASYVHANNLGQVRVNMPHGTGRLWGKIAEAYGAEVDINGFTFKPAPGTVFHGLPVLEGGVVEVRPGVTIPAKSPKILSIVATQVDMQENQLRRMIRTYTPYFPAADAITKDGGSDAQDLRLSGPNETPAELIQVRNLPGVLKRDLYQYAGVNKSAVDYAVDKAVLTGKGTFTAKLPPSLLNIISWKHPTLKTATEFNTLIAELEAQVEVWRAKFLPDDVVIFAPYWNEGTTTGADARSVHLTSTGKVYHVMTINLADKVAKHIQSKSAFRLQVVNNIAHEFGHFIHNAKWYKAPALLREAVLAEIKAIRAKVASVDKGKRTTDFWPSQLMNVPDQDSWGDVDSPQRTRFDATYYLTDSEIFAKSFAEILLEVEAKNPSSVFAKYIAEWKQVIGQFMSFVGWPKLKHDRAMRVFYEWLENPSILRVRETGKVPPSPSKPEVTDEDGLPVLYSKSITESMAEVSIADAQGIAQAQDIDIRGFWWMKKILNMPQLVDRFKVPALSVYWNLVKKIKTLKMEVLGEADATMREFNSLGGRRRAVTAALYELNNWSEAAERRLTDEEVVQAFMGTHPRYKSSEKLSEKEIGFILRVQQDFTNVLGRMEYAAMVRAAFGVLPDVDVDKFVHEWKQATLATEQDAVLQKYTNQPVNYIDANGDLVFNPLAQAMRDITAKFAGMKNRNYVPKMRHGNNVMRIVATEDCVIDGTPFQQGETILFQGFDQASEMESAAKEAYANATAMGIGVKIEQDILKDSEFSAVGLPRAFIDALKENEAMQFTEDQKRRMEAMALEMSPSRSFLKQFLKRQNIDGYSEDFERTYSSYMFRAAGHIAKTQFDRQVNYAIREFDRQKNRELTPGIANNSAWTELQNFVRSHFQYVMSADSDFSRTRSMISAWYLGFMPRSAIANLYQVPMATYPFLAGKYGDTAAVKAIAGAYKITEKALKNGKLPLHVDVALKRAYAEQHIDASAIVELGAMGDSNWIDRHIWPSKLGSSQKFYTKVVIDKGFWLFRNAEKINRRTTFLAAFELEYARTKDAEGAYQEAVKALELTQFDMSKEARAEMFRGGKGILFMFNQHLMGMTYLAFGGFSASKRQWAIGVRVLAMSAVLAGTEGLPWAGLGMDLFDLITKLYKQISGEEYTYSDVRADIRELYQSIGADPELWMHGMSRKFGLGPLSALQLFGAPEVDLSGSVGLGYPGSWAQMLKSTEGTSEERWAKMMESLGGPAYSILNGMWRTISSNNPNEWKAMESSLPAFMRAVSQGARWVEQGGEMTNNGAMIYEVNDDNLIDAAYRTMGLTPTKLAQHYSRHGVVAEAAAYWGGRKSTLLQEYGYAKMSGDSNLVRIAQENIRRYNNAVRENEVGKSFAISPKSLAISYKRRLQAIARIEAGMAANKNQQALMEQAYALQQPAGALLEQSNNARWGGGR